MARSRVKQDPNETISCPICGASFKRKSQYTHRKSEPCLVAQDKARAARLGWVRASGSGFLTKLCDVAGIPWGQLRTYYAPAGWGKPSTVNRDYFCAEWVAAVMLAVTSAPGSWKFDRICLALVALKADKDAQDGLVTCKAADGAGAVGSLALLSAYADALAVADPGVADRIRSALTQKP